MRKRLKKKQEIKEEIRHARIMRSFDIAQKIIQNAILISQIGRPCFSAGSFPNREMASVNAKPNIKPEDARKLLSHPAIN